MPTGEFPGFQLFTILKEGTVENRKALKSKKGKGLFGFGIQQTIDYQHVKEIYDKWENRKGFMEEKAAKATNERCSKRLVVGILSYRPSIPTT